MRSALWLAGVGLAPALATGQMLQVPVEQVPVLQVPAEQSVLSSSRTEGKSSISQAVWSDDQAVPSGAGSCPSCGQWHGWGRHCDMGGTNRLLGGGSTLLRHSSFAPRHVGLGRPLKGTSWLNRPHHVGWFMGTMFGDEIITDRVDQNSDFYGGYRVGWDLDHYWGSEARLGFAQLNLRDSAKNALPDTDSVLLGDVSLLYYPWGDSQWRPYFLAGIGFGNFHFDDEFGVGQDALMLGFPIGGGLKYQYRRWLALRIELLDNIALANQGLSTMHNVSLTFGVEVHHGAHPRSYWPWHPSRHIR